MLAMAARFAQWLPIAHERDVAARTRRVMKMAKHCLKSIGLAAFFAGCSLGVAMAQTPHFDPAELKALVKKPPGAAAPSGSGSGKLAGTPAAAPAAGWNTGHCWTSIWQYDGTNYYIYAFNVAGDYYYSYINSPLISSLQSTLLDVCRTGQQYGVYLNSDGAIIDVQTKW